MHASSDKLPLNVRKYTDVQSTGNLQHSGCSVRIYASDEVPVVEVSRQSSASSSWQSKPSMSELCRSRVLLAKGRSFLSTDFQSEMAPDSVAESFPICARTRDLRYNPFQAIRFLRVLHGPLFYTGEGPKVDDFAARLQSVYALHFRLGELARPDDLLDGNQYLWFLHKAGVTVEAVYTNNCEGVIVSGIRLPLSHKTPR
jgi:hypothetical protein